MAPKALSGRSCLVWEFVMRAQVTETAWLKVHDKLRSRGFGVGPRFSTTVSFIRVVSQLGLLIQIEGYLSESGEALASLSTCKQAGALSAATRQRQRVLRLGVKPTASKTQKQGDDTESQGSERDQGEALGRGKGRGTST